MKFRFYALLLISGFFTLASCKKDLPNPDKGGGNKSGGGNASCNQNSVVESKPAECFCDPFNIYAPKNPLDFDLSMADETILPSDGVGEVLNKIDQLSQNSVIFIHPNVDLQFPANLPGNHNYPIILPKGTRMVGFRGVNGLDGPILKMGPYTKKGTTLFKCKKGGLLIEGVNFKGNPKNKQVCFFAGGVGEHEFRYCLFSKWAGYGAISIRGLKNSVHHCYFLNNQIDGEGAGYGIFVGGETFVKASHNVFRANRHHISSSGDPGSSYEASYNLICGKNDNNSSFDVHDCNYCKNIPEHQDDDLKPPKCKENMGRAGLFFSIHDNNFVDPKFQSVQLRGRPKTGCFVYNNEFDRPEKRKNGKRRKNIRQQNYSGNLIAWGNEYNTKGTAWDFSINGKGKWQRLTSTYGDFRFNILDMDGDGTSELFRRKKHSTSVCKHYTADDVPSIHRNIWQVKHFEFPFPPYDPSKCRHVCPSIPKYASDWETVNASSVHTDKLLVGNFINGNGKDDVLWVDNGKWKFSLECKTYWQTRNTSVAPKNELIVGDFVGKERDDVIWMNGKKWRVSRGGRSSWEDLNVSSVKPDQVLVGDFIGDKKDDILWVKGNGQWKFSESGQGPWQDLNYSPNSSIDELAVGQFDKYPKDDVFWSSGGGTWYFSSTGTNSWQVLNKSGFHRKDLYFGDFNGDGRTDVAKTRKAHEY
jgi:hypothetical protein